MKSKSFKKNFQGNRNYTGGPEMKFAPIYLNEGSKIRFATYASVLEHIIQHIQKTFDNGEDIAVSLKKMEIVDLDAEAPVRAISLETNEDKRKIEQDGYDILYQERTRRHLDREDNLRKGLFKTYGLIFSNYCTRGMQHRIEEHPEFKTLIEDNPIQLLEAIKVLVHDKIRTQYMFITPTDVLTRWLNSR